MIAMSAALLFKQGYKKSSVTKIRHIVHVRLNKIRWNLKQSFKNIVGNILRNHLVALYLQLNDCVIMMRRDPFQAIADPTRREIINLVAREPQTPNSLAENFDVSRQAISKHIRILTESGILMLKIQGREYHYSIQPEKLEEVHDWLEPLRKIWEAKFNQLDDLLNTLQTKKQKSYDRTRKNNRKQTPGRQKN